MWSRITTNKGIHITKKELNLHNTLLSGQCFNWKSYPNNIYVGSVNKNVIALKEDDCNFILYKFLYKNNINLDEEKFFSDYFQLEVDLHSIYSAAKLKLPDSLKQVMDKYEGIRIIKQDVLECILSFICSSNNNIDRIRKMLASFKENYGELIYEDEEYGKFYGFPDLEDLKKTKISEENLKNLGFGYRAKFIKNSVEILLTQGSSWIENLQVMPDPGENLIKLEGVGQKVADCIMLFSLRKHHIVPLDIHMINFYNESVASYNKFPKITNINKRTYQQVSENYEKIFGPYAGWLHSAFYLNRIDKQKNSDKNIGSDDLDVKKKRKRKSGDSLNDESLVKNSKKRIKK